jgi:antitoxin component of MazEF toxin-antitoxin module
MIIAKEAKITKWGTSLGIRLPKEFTDICELEEKSMVRMEIRNGVLHIMPTKEPRKRKSLAKILQMALDNGTWDGTPAEITSEAKEWLDNHSAGAEVV